MNVGNDEMTTDLTDARMHSRGDGALTAAYLSLLGKRKKRAAMEPQTSTHMIATIIPAAIINSFPPGTTNSRQSKEKKYSHSLSVCPPTVSLRISSWFHQSISITIS
jgi:hypothetical protein